METNKLYFVSSNETKIKEAQFILGFPITIALFDLPEIQSLDISEVVRHKAVEAYKNLQKPVFVDDVGFYIDAWSGFPGPLVKFIIKTGGNKLLLKMLESFPNRRAEFVSAIGYHDGTIVQTFIGKVPGTIPLSPFPEDDKRLEAIFIPEGQSKRYSEMTIEEKSAISHRRKSLEQLKEHLNR